MNAKKIDKIAIGTLYVIAGAQAQTSSNDVAFRGCAG